MSISAQQAARELMEKLAELLPDRHISCYLSKRLPQDLRSFHLGETPRNFEDACIFFRVLFRKISHPEVVSFGRSRGPFVFGNILFAIKEYGERLRTFRNILEKTCMEHCQYEALFGVMCDALHHPVDYYDRFNSQNRRDFLIKGMIMVRIEQRRRFPPGPNCEVTYLFHFSLDEILEMIKKKNGVSGPEENRRCMKRSLKWYNRFWNEKYSEPIKNLLQEMPNFFWDFSPALELLYTDITRYSFVKNSWLSLMCTKEPKFYEDLQNAGICDKSKLWIIYRYMCYRKDFSSEPRQDQESFNDFMTRIVQPGQMAFPFKQPPELFKTNGEIFEAALKCESVPTSDLLEICYNSHVKSQYGTVPSQCVLAASVRRKLYEVKITKAAVKIQKMARRSLWHFYLKRLIAAMIIKQRVLRVVTPILQLKRANFLIASAAKRIFIQKVYFEKLDTYRYLEQIKAGCVIFKVLNRHNHVLEYQKIRAGSIIQSRLIALFERHRLKNFSAASTLSRFAKSKFAMNIVYKNFKKFDKDSSCYECPTCFSSFESVGISVIQPCGHIHCKDCIITIREKCSICRSQFLFDNCKSVNTILSQQNEKFFFTRQNPEKKAAIMVIIKWWTIKQSLLTETDNASL